MVCFNFSLDEPNTTIFEPVQSTNATLSSSSDVPESKHYAIYDALDKVALAVAALHRAGPHYKRASEIFWFFCAGSWSRARFDEQVKKSRKYLLGKPTERARGKKSVGMDVAFAEEKLHEAVAVLKRDGLHGDVQDLLWAIEAYQSGGNWW